jgi:hypothetical protein
MQKYPPLIINQRLARDLRSIRVAEVRDEDARQILGKLLQSALGLEFATIPPYLSAAFSLGPENQNITDLLRRVAKEEMLHLTTIANLMNAIGVPPDIIAAVPDYPYQLDVLATPLTLELRSFSLDLVENLLMRIEAPEHPVVFTTAFLAPGATSPTTIGLFYAQIIDIIQSEKIADLFVNAGRDAYKQRTVDPNFATPIAYTSNQDTQTYPLKPGFDFLIKDPPTAVRYLKWLVGEGEGASPYDPTTAEGLPGHFYRFESILKRKYLVKGPSATLGYSYSGGDLLFTPAAVTEFTPNAKAGDYGSQPELQKRMKRFNDTYTIMVNALQSAFNCPRPEQQAQSASDFQTAISSMRRTPNLATAIVQKAHEVGVKAGVPFEYGGRPTS